MPDQFFMLYNTLGYERYGTKKAFVRTIFATDALPQMDTHWVLKTESGTAAARGKFTYRGISFGLQLWEADFSDVRVQGRYTLSARFDTARGDIVYEESSDPFLISESLYTKEMLLPLTIHNARNRRALPEEGGGYYDCNSRMGEAYSHGVFLKGLTEAYALRQDKLSEEEKKALLEAAQIAFDYLLPLHTEDGEFLHCDPRRPGADLNHGVYNTYEALYGFTAYLRFFKDADPARANAGSYAKAVSSVRYMCAHAEDAAMCGHPDLDCLVPVCYDLYCFSGDRQWLAMGEELIDKRLAVYNLRSMLRSSSRAISFFEGVCRFAALPELAEKRGAWFERIQEVKAAYYSDLPQRNAFGIVPMTNLGVGTQEAEWDDMSRLPTAWQFSPGRTTQAIDACYIGIMTGDPVMETIAAGELGAIMGLNAGFPANQAEHAPAGRAMTAGALVENLNARHARPWYYWEFTPSDPCWMTIINGFRMENGQYNYQHTEWDDWRYSETFIKQDGGFAYALCLYEDLVKRLHTSKSYRRSPA